MIKVLIFILIAEIWTAVGHIMLKKSTNSLELHSLSSAGNITRFIGKVLSKPSAWIGLASMGIGMIVWLMALAQAQLSIVFSIGSIQYIMILFLAHYLLGEKIDGMKLAGTLLVAIGIVIITIS